MGDAGGARPLFNPCPPPACQQFVLASPASRAVPHPRMANAKHSNIPAWGGGAGSRLASTAAAKKLQTVKDRQQGRSASAAGFRPSEQPSTATSACTASW